MPDVQKTAPLGYSRAELILDAVEHPEIAAVAFAAAGPVAAGFKRVVWFPGGGPYPAVSDIPEREIASIEGRLRGLGVNGSGPMSFTDPRALGVIALQGRLLKLARRYRTDLQAPPLRGGWARSVRDGAVRAWRWITARFPRKRP